MSRRKKHHATVGAETLEGRNLMSTLPLIGVSISAEVRGAVPGGLAARGFNPQPDPPGSTVGSFDTFSGVRFTYQARPMESI